MRIKQRDQSYKETKFYYKGLDNIGKNKDIGKTQDVKSNKSDDMSVLLHHAESTANADLKCSVYYNNNVLFWLKLCVIVNQRTIWVVLTCPKGRVLLIEQKTNVGKIAWMQIWSSLINLMQSTKFHKFWVIQNISNISQRGLVLSQD